MLSQRWGESAQAGAQAGRQAGVPGEEAGRSAQDGDGNRDVVRGEGEDRERMEQLMETEV